MSELVFLRSKAYAFKCSAKQSQGRFIDEEMKHLKVIVNVKYKKELEKVLNKKQYDQIMSELLFFGSKVNLDDDEMKHFKVILKEKINYKKELEKVLNKKQYD